MKNKIEFAKFERIMPYLLGFGALILFFFCYLLGTNRVKIDNVLVTNISDTAVSVIWTSDQKSTSSITYSDVENLSINQKTINEDDRDIETSHNKFFTHHVTISDLNPLKTYYFKIDGANSSINKFTTIDTLEDVVVPDPVYGKIVTENGEIETDVIVVLNFESNDGSYRSDFVSTYLNSSGAWSLDVSSFDDKNIVEKKEIIKLLTSENFEHEKTYEIDTNQDQPAGDIVLRQKQKSKAQSPNINNAVLQTMATETKIISDGLWCGAGDYCINNEKVTCSSQTSCGGSDKCDGAGCTSAGRCNDDPCKKTTKQKNDKKEEILESNDKTEEVQKNQTIADTRDGCIKAMGGPCDKGVDKSCEWDTKHVWNDCGSSLTCSDSTGKCISEEREVVQNDKIQEEKLKNIPEDREILANYVKNGIDEYCLKATNNTRNVCLHKEVTVKATVANLAMENGDGIKLSPGASIYFRNGGKCSTIADNVEKQTCENYVASINKGGSKGECQIQGGTGEEGLDGCFDVQGNKLSTKSLEEWCGYREGQRNDSAVYEACFSANSTLAQLKDKNLNNIYALCDSDPSKCDQALRTEAIRYNGNTADCDTLGEKRANMCEVYGCDNVMCYYAYASQPDGMATTVADKSKEKTKSEVEENDSKAEAEYCMSADDESSVAVKQTGKKIAIDSVEGKTLSFEGDQVSECTAEYSDNCFAIVKYKDGSEVKFSNLDYSSDECKGNACNEMKTKGSKGVNRDQSYVEVIKAKDNNTNPCDYMNGGCFECSKKLVDAGVNKSSETSYKLGNSLFSGAYAQESANNFFEESTDYANGFKPGVYEYISNIMTTKSIIVDENSHVVYFDDRNSNGVKDNDEMFLSPKEVGDLNIEVGKTQDVVGYKLNIGWNLLSFPMILADSNNKKVVLASELMTYLNTKSADTIHIVTYRDGKFLTYSNRDDLETEFGNDFSILPGEGYFVNIKNPVNVDFIGLKVENALEVNLQSGWNLVGIYNSNNESFGAFGILDQIGNQSITADTISKWESGQYQNAVMKEKTQYGQDFKIYPTQGYWVRVEGAGGKFGPK